MPRASKPHLSKGYYRVRIDGQVHWLGADKSAALTKFHRLMAERGEAPDPDRPKTIDGLIEAWLLIHPGQDRENRLADLHRFAGKKPLADVRAELLEEYETHLRNVRKLAPSTTRDRVRIAKSILVHAAHRSRRWIRETPDMPRLAKPAKVAKDVPPDILRDAFADMAKCKRTARALRVLKFILATGCRPSEACRLRWEWVRMDTATATLPEHKTAKSGKARTLYLTPEALEILAGMPDHADAGPVFVSHKGEPYKVNGLRSILHRRNIAGPYRLRHTFGQTRSEQISLQDLAAQMGHSDLKTTAHYFNVRDGRARKVAGELPPMLAAQDTGEPADPDAVVLKLPDEKAGSARKGGKVRHKYSG